MNTKQIYLKTMTFILAKFGLGMLSFLISAIWLLPCLFIGSFFDGYVVFISLFIGCGGIWAIYYFINSYIGYLIKAAHIAVIVQAIQSGSVPDGPFEFGIKQVKERFITTNVFAVIDKLIDGAVKQLQGIINKADNIFGNVPGLSMIFSFLKVFTNIALGYVDECCLGYVFYKKEQSAFQSACDGIVIYFKNWKKLWKDIAMTAVLAIAACALTWMFSYGLIYGMFLLFHGSQFVAFILVLLLTRAVKNSFIDSFILIRMMIPYLQIAEVSEIDSKLYKKFCMISDKFKEMLTRGEGKGENVY